MEGYLGLIYYVDKEEFEQIKNTEANFLKELEDKGISFFYKI